jgi:hypothetical protein
MFGMSNMKKIKSNLVTFVTDKVLVVTYFGNEDFLRACCKQDDETASREETKKVAMRQQ